MESFVKWANEFESSCLEFYVVSIMKSIPYFQGIRGHEPLDRASLVNKLVAEKEAAC